MLSNQFLAATVVALSILSQPLRAQDILKDSPLSPVKTDHPRDTMRTFMENMDRYREASLNDQANFINRAIRTLDFESKVLDRNLEARKVAMMLKETIDRVIVIKYNLIPDDASLDRWRLKGTEVTIARMPSGHARAGEFLFSADTVKSAPAWYETVKHLPYLPNSGQGAGYQSAWFERELPDWAQGKTLELFHWQWIGIFLAILLGLIFKAVVGYIVHLLKKVAEKSQGKWDDKLIGAIERPIGTIAATGVWYLALNGLAIDGVANTVLMIAIQIVFSVAMIWLFLNITDVATQLLQNYAKRSDVPIDDQLVPLLRRAARLFVAIFGILVSIQNLGINVMSLLAGLGLGGLAFALAAKDTAANLFGSVMILWDQPFKVGDWIRSGGNEGTVEEIGFRSTRIRTFYDSQISIPNSELANAHIDNMGRRKFRRIKTQLGVTYDTPPDKMQAFIDGIKGIIESHPSTRKDYFHVVFNNYGPSSLDVLLYFFLEVPNWTDELQDRQAIFMNILKLAEKIGVSFAFPSQSVYLESMPSQKELPQPV